jgi:hypothetical protein
VSNHGPPHVDNLCKLLQQLLQLALQWAHASSNVYRSAALTAEENAAQHQQKRHRKLLRCLSSMLHFDFYITCRIMKRQTEPPKQGVGASLLWQVFQG